MAVAATAAVCAPVHGRLGLQIADQLFGPHQQILQAVAMPFGLVPARRGHLGSQRVNGSAERTQFADNIHTLPFRHGVP